MTDDRHDPSDEGAPPGAPRPIKPTPEIIALALEGLNEEQVLAELQAAEGGRWFKLEDFIGELEALAPRPDEPCAGRG